MGMTVSDSLRSTSLFRTLPPATKTLDSSSKVQSHLSHSTQADPFIASLHGGGLRQGICPHNSMTTTTTRSEFDFVK